MNIKFMKRLLLFLLLSFQSIVSSAINAASFGQSVQVVERPDGLVFFTFYSPAIGSEVEQNGQRPFDEAEERLTFLADKKSHQILGFWKASRLIVAPENPEGKAALNTDETVTKLSQYLLNDSSGRSVRETLIVGGMKFISLDRNFVHNMNAEQDARLDLNIDRDGNFLNYLRRRKDFNFLVSRYIHRISLGPGSIPEPFSSQESFERFAKNMRIYRTDSLTAFNWLALPRKMAPSYELLHSNADILRKAGLTEESFSYNDRVTKSEVNLEADISSAALDEHLNRMQGIIDDVLQRLDSSAVGCTQPE